MLLKRMIKLVLMMNMKWVISRNGAPPQRRHIETLGSRNRDMYESGSEDELHLLDEYAGRDDSQAADDTTYLRRPQSTTGSLRLASVRSVRSKCFMLIISEQFFIPNK